MFTALINVRFAMRDDATALADIFCESWRLAYQGILPHKDLMQLISQHDAKWWSSAVDRRHILVVEYENNIVGYAHIGLNRRPALQAQGEIFELYILPVYQGLGLGSRLFKEARHFLYLRGYDGLIVWALSDNQIACDFYEGKGGKEVAQTFERFSSSSVHKVAFLWDASGE